MGYLIVTYLASQILHHLSNQFPELNSIWVICVFLATPRTMPILIDKNKKFYFLDHKYDVFVVQNMENPETYIN